MYEHESRELDGLVRALADPTRRRIYSILRAEPGLTTNQIAGRIVGITRWGVMKHLAVLREAGLVHSLPEGRRRRHYSETAALAPLRRWLATADGGD